MEENFGGVEGSKILQIAVLGKGGVVVCSEYGVLRYELSSSRVCFGVCFWFLTIFELTELMMNL